MFRMRLYVGRALNVWRGDVWKVVEEGDVFCDRVSLASRSFEKS